ncbi:TIGR01244 family sulfur transferase [Qipengyuania sp. ASV99]|uniref:TIGR01244 family sulfur transferase n=1 Tax=Qipengyuania sp. ASV99 TaxID=3399681 RepID=UPI003A4C649D
MSDFRTLSPTVLASPQISLEDIESAKAAGVTLIVNNRPDGEEPSAPQGDAIAAAASAAGIGYLAIPIDHTGYGETQVDAMAAALADAEGKVLAYCRSGTRSTFLWSLAQAKVGAAPDDIATAAQAAGYDITPVRPLLDLLAAKAN